MEPIDFSNLGFLVLGLFFFVPLNALRYYFSNKGSSFLGAVFSISCIPFGLLSLIPLGAIHILFHQEVVNRAERAAHNDYPSLVFETYRLKDERDSLRDELSRLETTSRHYDGTIQDLTYRIDSLQYRLFSE